MAEADAAAQSSRGPEPRETLATDGDITIEEMLGSGLDLDYKMIESDEFVDAIQKGYNNDRMMRIILDRPSEHPLFQIKDSMI